MAEFVSIPVGSLKDNVFSAIGDQWMLITASKPDGTFNTMTASWGGLGILWNKPVAFTFIRPQRYTYEFSEAGEYATLSFFDASMRQALTFCGRQSGRNVDKINACGLTPVTDKKGTYFEEARLVLRVRKLYADDLKECCFIDKAQLAHYEKKDFHRVYISEIEEVLQKNK